MSDVMDVRFNGVRWADVKKPVSFWFFWWPLVIAHVLIAATICDPPKVTPMLTLLLCTICGGIVLGNLPRFIRRNMIGIPVYFWLNESTLEIHDVDWWIGERGKPVVEGPILKIWFGGWFRKDLVCDNKQNWSIRAEFSLLTGKLWRLRLRDKAGNSIYVTNVVLEGKNRVNSYTWNLGLLTQILKMLSHTEVRAVIDSAG